MARVVLSLLSPVTISCCIPSVRLQRWWSDLWCKFHPGCRESPRTRPWRHKTLQPWEANRCLRYLDLGIVFLHASVRKALPWFYRHSPRIQQSHYVIPELLKGEDREPGPETRNCKGRRCALFPVFVTEIFYWRKLICASGWSFQIRISISVFFAMASLHGVDLKPLRTLFYSLLLVAEFVFAIYALTDPRFQQQDWLKQIWSKRKFNAPFTQI